MFKLVKRLNKIDWLYFGIAIVIIVLQVFLDILSVSFTRQVVTLISTGSIKDILIQGGFMLLCSLGSLTGAIICGFLFSIISARLARNLRRDLYLKVQGLAMSDLHKFSISSLITRTTNDITNVQVLIAMGMQMIIKAPITAIWAIVEIAKKDYWQWSVLTCVAVITILVGVGIIFALVLPKFKKVQAYIDDLNNVTEEQLTGIRVVRAFNAEAYQEAKFAEKNQTLTKTQIFNQRTMGFMNPIIYFVMNMMSLCIYWIGAYLINGVTINEKLDLFSNMVTFNGYASMVISAFLMLVMIFIMWPRASVSAARINEVLNTKNELLNGNYCEPTAITGTVEFKNVSFKYPNAEDYTLKDISFKVEAGNTLAFIGSTGSGKTTIINLLMRFYDCTSGEIFIDGINIKDYDLKTLYNKIGYVPQKAVILSGTVTENIAFGENGKGPIDDAQIKTAVAVSQSQSFVEKMTDTYQAQIAQSGTNLSGGQKQRLAIARAIARDPEIYVFDDAFSALDYATDYKLRSELKQHTHNATNIIVAQRIGTIMNANTIVVLEKGECVGIGTHKELLKSCQTYREIAYSQLSKEELANG